MSSELQSVVSSIVENDYVTLVILTTVGYDYILTLSDEIEYVWSKPWTRVSTLFVLIRYFGLCGVIIYTLRRVLGIFGQWALFVFISAADMVMILRVWAVYTQSRIILGILLTLYAVEIVPYIVACISTSLRLTAVTIQVPDFSFCLTRSGSIILAEVNDVAQFTLSTTMWLLMTAQFIRHLFEMYKVRKRWQPSRYMSLFAREGLLYFLATFLYGLVNILFVVAKIPFSGWWALPIGILEDIPVFTLTPRFILSVRALYARDLQGRRGPPDMDNGFGLTSVPVSGVHVPAIICADTREGEEEEEEFEEEGEIQMAER